MQKIKKRMEYLNNKSVKIEVDTKHGKNKGWEWETIGTSTIFYHYGLLSQILQSVNIYACAKA